MPGTVTGVVRLVPRKNIKQTDAQGNVTLYPNVLPDDKNPFSCYLYIGPGCENKLEEFQQHKVMKSGDLPGIWLITRQAFRNQTVIPQPMWVEDNEDPVYGRRHYEVKCEGADHVIAFREFFGKHATEVRPFVRAKK